MRVRGTASIVAAAMLLAGCTASRDLDKCVPPPKVDCRDFEPPVGDWPEGVTNEEAARIAIGVRNCTSAVGRPHKVLREVFGKPTEHESNGVFDETTDVWVPSDELWVIAPHDRYGHTTGISLSRQTQDSSVLSEYCGEPDSAPTSS